MGWSITYAEFLGWWNFFKDEEAPLNEQAGRNEVRWIAAFCTAVEVREDFKAKDLAQLWYNPDEVKVFMTEEDVQEWLDEQTTLFDDREEFLAYVESTMFN